MLKNKKILIIVISVVIVCAITATVLSVTLAKWQTKADQTIKVDMDVVDYNPSAQYIIYRGLTSDGAFTDDTAAISSWAVVGYKGLVAELVIPAEHEGKPVTHILASDTVVEDRLSGNPIITEMTIPHTVIYIGSGVCSMMTELKTVSIKAPPTAESPASIAIANLAFAGCGKLSTFSSERSIEGEESSYLMGTAIKNQ